MHLASNYEKATSLLAKTVYIYMFNDSILHVSSFYLQLLRVQRGHFESKDMLII
jgi:hypothetical protein